MCEPFEVGGGNHQSSNNSIRVITKKIYDGILACAFKERNLETRSIQFGGFAA